MMSLGMRTMTTSMLWMTELEMCPSAQTIDRIARDLLEFRIHGLAAADATANNLKKKNLAALTKI